MRGLHIGLLKGLLFHFALKFDMTSDTIKDATTIRALSVSYDNV